ncbi:MAG: hypothetical protein BKP49_06575 [Treponema sp. CETP13]|nr:MAG: hypothetical protein BKP49_06575 [Treponema sp. CETP13]
MNSNLLRAKNEPVLLCAINSRYNHTNIAVRSIVYYTQDRLAGTNPLEDDVLLPVDFGEWTINQPIGDILRGINEKCMQLKRSQPVAPLILFSVYIWNVEITYKVIHELKKIMPNCVIGVGGPEVSFKDEKIFTELKELDLVIRGEGEQVTLELITEWNKFHSMNSDVSSLQVRAFDKTAFYNAISSIPSICVPYQNAFSKNIRCPFTDLDCLPFPYPYLNDPDHQDKSDSQYLDPDNKIFYYESSRGCPFNCAYCMSSIDKTVRFRSLDKVFADIQCFMDAKVKLVKFVDRTFNLEPSRYIAIWKYIYQHHNDKTMFHFEIAAEQFTDEALDFLQNIPAGMMQFEIGVQSTNQKTLKAIHRQEHWEKLTKIVKRIPHTIEQHLDLIAGLPFEDLQTFGKSINDILLLKPDVLQLGFLKVLSGTEMSDYKDIAQWKWMSSPPYEILTTPVLSYNDVLFLKDIETLIDVFWNSKNFVVFMRAIQTITSVESSTIKKFAICRNGIFGFFSDLVVWCRERNIFDSPHRAPFWFECINDFIKTQSFPFTPMLHDFLRFDYISMGKTSGFPQWCEHNYNKDLHRKALDEHVFSQELATNEYHSTRRAYAHSEYDTFSYNPLLFHNKEVDNSIDLTFMQSKTNPVKILFLYANPEPGKDKRPCKVIEIRS